MQLTDLWSKSILILGFGVEGLSTYRFLRELFPQHRIGIADQNLFERLPAEAQEILPSDPDLVLHLGPDYLSNLTSYDVIVKSPGIPLVLPEIQFAITEGKTITSHTQIFFKNCPGTIIGVTGTKGKGTTSKLIHSILNEAGFDAHLVGNIGIPPLPLLKQARQASYFVYELSAQQLESLTESPRIAVLLNIVPDHLDHFSSFDKYVEAKANITIHQTSRDYLVYNAHFPITQEIANRSNAQLIPISLQNDKNAYVYIENQIVQSSMDSAHPQVMSIAEILQSVAGEFNLENVLPAIAVAKVLSVESATIKSAVKKFTPLPNRFENVGTFRGVTFYNASIATVPEVTMGHLTSLHGQVDTMLLGGFDRGLDFSELGKSILTHRVKNLILFPTTGIRILNAVKVAARQSNLEVPRYYLLETKDGVEAMREAVTLAYSVTDRGKICLHSPASPSFGLFRNFTERGTLFKEFVVQLGNKQNGPE